MTYRSEQAPPTKHGPDPVGRVDRLPGQGPPLVRGRLPGHVDVEAEVLAGADLDLLQVGAVDLRRQVPRFGGDGSGVVAG